ncbi:MAG: SDR family oxidoreductase, partial [Acidimicrobiia bacterium]
RPAEPDDRGVKVLVTGASGVLGRRVVERLVSGGHTVRAAGRRQDAGLPAGAQAVRLDIATGAGLAEAVSGVEAIVHCATDPRRHREVDMEGRRRMLEGVAGGSPHIVFPGIVGADVVPLRYYASKVAVEELLAGSGMPWTILRATQFHHLVWYVLSRLARLPVLPVPSQVRFQVIDPGLVADRLAAAVEAGPRGRLPDLGGPHAYQAKDLASSYLAATRRWKPVLPLPIPGIVGAALRAGGNLTPNRAEGSPTWNDFVAHQIAR